MDTPAVNITSLLDLPALDSKGHLNVIVETTQGSRNKYKYDDEFHCMKLSSVLTEGAVFPFDFGFIPSTAGDDGDPMDVLLFSDESVFPGCLVKARLIGVINAEQKNNRKTYRNDRLIAVAIESQRYAKIVSLKDLDSKLLDQIEYFFVSYNIPRKRKFKVISRLGPKQALKLLKSRSVEVDKWQRNENPPPRARANMSKRK